jgi:hypothetical protein
MVKAFTGLCRGIVNNADAVRHHDMLPLAKDAKASLLKGPHGIEVIDAGNFWHR